MNSQIPALKDLPQAAMPVIHGFIALWGFLDCFFGLRIFKVTIRIFMSFAGTVGAAYVAAHFYPDSAAVFFGACVMGLILGFILGWYVYKIGVVLLAVFAGFVLVAPFAASLGQPLDAVVSCAVGILAGFVAFILLEPVIIASTALTGAFRLVFGVAFFMGGASIATYVSGEQRFDTMFFGGNKWMSVGTLAIAAIGFFVQFSAWRKSNKIKGDEE